MGEPRRIYPKWVKPPYSKLHDGLSETMGRIADRTDGWLAAEAEKRAALAWCQANGNPHRPPIDNQTGE